MAYVERLRDELMGTLGFEVERQSKTPSRSETRLRDEIQVPAPGRVGKVRRRLGDAMAEAAQGGGPYAQAHCPHRKQRGHRYAAADDSKMAYTGESAHHSKLLRGSRHRRRPMSASSARHSEYTNRTYNSGNKEMGVLLEICRDQGRASSLDPADFDSSISAIANLPVGQFMGAAKEGWGTYFRNLHIRMRKEGAASAAVTRKNRPPPDRQKRLRQQALPKPRRPSSRSTRAMQPTTNEQTKTIKSRNNSSSNSRSGSVGSLVGRRRRQSNSYSNADDLATSRAEAAEREAGEEMTRRMADRLQTLWQELKIPDPDRAYITASYIEAGRGRSTGRNGREEMKEGGCGVNGEPSRRNGNGGPKTIEVHRELARQIRLLLEHRAATVKVLHSVTERESRLTQVEQMLQAFQWHRGLDTDAIGVVSALAGLRNASVEVVRSVLDWRKNLWQPRAFCWQGVNYLEKMSQDANFLRSPVGANLLASVGLAAKDLMFVLFPAADGGDTPVEEAPRFGNDSRFEALCGDDVKAKNVFRPPPAIVRLTPKAELVLQYRAHFFEQLSAPAVSDTTGAETEAAGSGGREEGFEGGGGRPPRTPSDGADIVNMQSTVVHEAALQRRVEADRIRLATKGCFVPLLRWLPGDSRNATLKGRRRQSSSSPPPTVPQLSTGVNAEPGAEPTLAVESNEKNEVRSGSNTVHGDGDKTRSADSARTLGDKAEARCPSPASGGISHPDDQQEPSPQPQPQAKHPQHPQQAIVTATVAGGVSTTQGLILDGAEEGRADYGQRDTREKDKANEEIEYDEWDQDDEETETESQPVEGGSSPMRQLTPDDAEGRTSPTLLEKPYEEYSTEGEDRSEPCNKTIVLGKVACSGGACSSAFDQTQDMEEDDTQKMQASGVEDDTGLAQEKTNVIDTENNACESVCLKSSSNGTEGLGGIGLGFERSGSGNVGGDTRAEETSLSDPRKSEKEDDACEEKSTTHSIYYDDDFEDDAQGYSTSASEGGCDGGTVSSGDGSQSRRCRKKCDGGHQNQDGRKQGTVSPREGIIHTADERNSLDAAADTRLQHSRRQQLVEEQERMAMTGARIIQRSVRGWLNRHPRLQEGGIDGPEQEDLHQQGGEKEEKGEENQENKEWLTALRMKRHSQLKHAQTQQTKVHTNSDREHAANRIQIAIRRRIASGQEEDRRRTISERELTAACTIQAMVRRRWRKTTWEANSRRPLGEEVGSEQYCTAEQELRRKSAHCDEPAGRREGQAYSPLPMEFGSESAEAEAKNTRCAIMIQRAVRRAHHQKQRLSSIPLHGGVAESSTEQSSKHQEDEEEKQEQRGVRDEENYSGLAVVASGSRPSACPATKLSKEQAMSTRAPLSSSPNADADDGLHSLSSSSVFDDPFSSNSSSGSQDIDMTFDDFGDDGNLDTSLWKAGAHSSKQRHSKEGILDGIGVRGDSSGGSGQEQLKVVQPTISADSSRKLTASPRGAPKANETNPTADKENFELLRSPEENLGHENAVESPSSMRNTRAVSAVQGGTSTANDRKGKEEDQQQESFESSPLSSIHHLSLDGSTEKEATGDAMSVDLDTNTMGDALMTTVVGGPPLGSSAVGLSSVPERRALLGVAGSGSASEYGSDDLNFDALSTSSVSRSSKGIQESSALAGEAVETPNGLAEISPFPPSAEENDPPGGQEDRPVAPNQRETDNNQEADGMATGGGTTEFG